MRLYGKMMLFVAVFLGLASPAGRRITENLAYEARVFLVYRFGSEANFEALLQDTDRMLAAERCSLEAYFAAERHRQQAELFAKSAPPSGRPERTPPPPQHRAVAVSLARSYTPPQ